MLLAPRTLQQVWQPLTHVLDLGPRPQPPPEAEEEAVVGATPRPLRVGMPRSGPAAASAGPTTGPVSGTSVRLLPAKKRLRLSWLAVRRPRHPCRAFSCGGGGTVDNAEGCTHG